MLTQGASSIAKERKRFVVGLNRDSRLKLTTADFVHDPFYPIREDPRGVKSLRESPGVTESSRLH